MKPEEEHGAGGKPPGEPVFLTLEEVLFLHADQIRRYGGISGLRDAGLLSSALGAVSATFDGEYLHGTVVEMAAAYLFHLAQNHPFLDGNKRVGLAAALSFLWLNGFDLEADPGKLTSLVLRVAEGQATKAEVAVFFEHRVRETDPA